MPKGFYNDKADYLIIKNLHPKKLDNA